MIDRETAAIEPPRHEDLVDERLVIAYFLAALAFWRFRCWAAC